MMPASTEGFVPSRYTCRDGVTLSPLDFMNSVCEKLEGIRMEAK